VATVAEQHVSCLALNAFREGLASILCLVIGGSNIVCLLAIVGPFLAFCVFFLENPNELLGACELLGVTFHDSNTPSDIQLREGVPGGRKRGRDNCLELYVCDMEIAII
jgi:hypothetical protein